VPGAEPPGAENPSGAGVKVGPPDESRQRKRFAKDVAEESSGLPHDATSLRSIPRRGGQNDADYAVGVVSRQLEHGLAGQRMSKIDGGWKLERQGPGADRVGLGAYPEASGRAFGTSKPGKVGCEYPEALPCESGSVPDPVIGRHPKAMKEDDRRARARLTVANLTPPQPDAPGHRPGRRRFAQGRCASRPVTDQRARHSESVVPGG
jgi:hypothetical protein